MHTIPIQTYEKNGKALFSRLSAQKVLKVHHRRTWRSHLQAVGINPDDNPTLTWSDIKHLLALQLFLQARNGVHSVYQFSRIFREGLLDAALTRFQIDLDTEFRRLKNGYYQ
ncbi:hypothetical protein IQ249_15055 [Lusitaniella coriacea LEGE 07157]|uniref:Uncharacterized protein n=1 Tax=Lusitaniella coriacea LEGE 07157 TaxID=945747 RepID=A0A8J7DXI2_9CYAN|nr:hypothetical protein [Lusitaniella coriacea]MBE9117217.1 hypothetical protein [Lusitaniella coriacea LEGE 07157]